MRIDIVIWNIIKILVIPKIFLYRIIFWIKFPIGSIIYWLPKIRNWKLIRLWKWFQLWRLCRMNWNIKVWNNFFMNEFWTISSWVKSWKIIIWDDVMIWPLFYMISWDHWFIKWLSFNKSNDGKKWNIKIWNNVWIWARVTILKWVTIWNNVVIWAWSVVTKDIQDNSLAVWNPCKVKKKI